MPYPVTAAKKSGLDRALSLFADVRGGEGLTAVLLLTNIFLLLICYSVIKTVREPLILLGGGAEVRSYAAAGQALLLMGFVPLYSWFASRVNRGTLLIGVTLFFIVCIELFAAAVAAGVPYVGVAFFVWVGIFNMSLVAQFWSFANDLYSKEAGDRLFPIIVVGMTAGAPVGSFVAGHLFRLGITPQVILQLSAVLLSISVMLYVRINARETTRGGSREALASGGGFSLVLNNRYLRLIAALVILLNVVNTTGEYLVAKLLTAHVSDLAHANPAFNKQAFIGAFSGDYQFWVNIVAFALQALVASRLVKYKGLAGVLLVLPLIALGGYTIIAAGAGFSIVRWIKTAENATDYSIMNTARQLLWLPTTREEKYKAKQAIDTFFVRTGDVLSAGLVYVGTAVLHLTISQFATVNIVLTGIWLGIAALLLVPKQAHSFKPGRQFATAAAALAALLWLSPVDAFAQETREGQLAAERAQKATELHPYVPDSLERKIDFVDRTLFAPRKIYTFMGSPFEGGGFAIGPGYRVRYADTGVFDAHAGWSIRNYKVVDTTLTLPQIANGRVNTAVTANWLDAPTVAFFGLGNDSKKADRASFLYRTTSVGMSTHVQAVGPLAVGGGIDAIASEARATSSDSGTATLDPTYARTHAFVEIDTRTSPAYSRNGGLYRVEVSDYRQINGNASNFRRMDAEVQRFVPILRENWVIALRALASTTDTGSSESVPYFLMPSLGGNHFLRGYSTWRFRDRNRMLFSGEYRWTAGPLVDMALFMDAGKVASRTADMNFSGLKTSQGVDLTLHTPSATLTRIEFAHSREGLSIGFSFSPSF
ncbi:MAG TPA: BamA/TamA family outer membrane protein [Vicinamibacterales bacterium]